MKVDKLKTQILYGIISGTIYATIIAVLDYFRDKEFNLKKFIIGLVIFGIIMIIVSGFRDKSKN